MLNVACQNIIFCWPSYKLLSLCFFSVRKKLVIIFWFNFFNCSIRSYQGVCYSIHTCNISITKIPREISLRPPFYFLGLKYDAKLYLFTILFFRPYRLLKKGLFSTSPEISTKKRPRRAGGGLLKFGKKDYCSTVYSLLCCSIRGYNGLKLEK